MGLGRADVGMSRPLPGDQGRDDRLGLRLVSKNGAVLLHSESESQWAGHVGRRGLGGRGSWLGVGGVQPCSAPPAVIGSWWLAPTLLLQQQNN